LIRYLYIFFLSATVNVSAQNCNYHSGVKDQNNLCDYVNGLLSEQDYYAEIALEKVLSKIDSPINFFLVPCDGIDNCMATTYKGLRYILYDKNFIKKVAVLNDWASTSIFAHEVGHHILGHTINISMYSSDDLPIHSLELSKTMELEADEFSGIILARLGAKIEDATIAVNNLINDYDDTNSTHPTKSKRINAITVGYKKGLDLSYKIKTLPKDKNEYTCWMSGHTMYREKEYSKALLYFKESISINPYFYMSYLSIGKIYDDLGLNDQAIAYISKAIEININLEIAYSLLGFLYYKVENLKKSFEYYAAGIKLYPNVAFNYLGVGMIYSDYNDNVNALKYYKIANDIDPRDPLILTTMADLYYSTSDYRNAVYYYDKAIFWGDNSSDNYFYRGLSKCKLNNVQSGCKDLLDAQHNGHPEASKYYIYFCK